MVIMVSVVQAGTMMFHTNRKPDEADMRKWTFALIVLMKYNNSITTVVLNVVKRCSKEKDIKDTLKNSRKVNKSK